MDAPLARSETVAVTCSGCATTAALKANELPATGSSDSAGAKATDQEAGP